jgi:hypothetical protein
MDLKIKKPEPIELGKDVELFKRGVNVKQTIEALEAGKSFLIKEFYNNGLTLLDELQKHLDKKYSDETFKDQRDSDLEYHKLSSQLLIEVVNHKLPVTMAPSIGWFKIFYPENKSFVLTFPQVQELDISWQEHQDGVSIPVVRNKVHPYYGTHLPTSYEHLVLLDNWLKRYEGPKKTAIDVGIGNGVLSFQLVKHGFQKSFGTDINPNAIFGLIEFMGETKLSRKIELDLGHLFAKWDKPTEMIVFNPPWLPINKELDRVDDAVYYTEKLFSEFFTAAKERLLPDGKLVLTFSNLAQLTGVAKDHPIEKELAEGKRFKLEKMLTKSVRASSDKTNRYRHLFVDEEVQLWILTHQ